MFLSYLSHKDRYEWKNLWGVMAVTSWLLRENRYYIGGRMSVVPLASHSVPHYPKHSFLYRRIEIFVPVFLIPPLLKPENLNSILSAFLHFLSYSKWSPLELDCLPLPFFLRNSKCHIAVPKSAASGRWHRQNLFLHRLVDARSEELRKVSDVSVHPAVCRNEYKLPWC